MHNEKATKTEKTYERQELIQEIENILKSLNEDELAEVDAFLRDMFLNNKVD